MFLRGYLKEQLLIHTQWWGLEKALSKSNFFGYHKVFFNIKVSLLGILIIASYHYFVLHKFVL